MQKMGVLGWGIVTICSTSSFVTYFFFFFSPSLLMTSCLGNIQWRWAPTALVSYCNSRFLNASCLSRPPSTFFSLSLSCFSLSFFNSHPSNRVSCSYLLRAWDQVLFRVRPFARQWSFAGGRSCFVSNSFDYYLLELAAGFDLASFRKNALWHILPKFSGFKTKFLVRFKKSIGHGT